MMTGSAVYDSSGLRSANDYILYLAWNVIKFQPHQAHFLTAQNILGGERGKHFCVSWWLLVMFICKGNNTEHKSSDMDSIVDVSQQWLMVTLGHIEHALLLSSAQWQTSLDVLSLYGRLGRTSLESDEGQIASWCMTVEHVLGWQTAMGRVTLEFRWNSGVCQKALSLSPSARTIPLLDMHVKYKQISLPQGHFMIKEGARRREGEVSTAAHQTCQRRTVKSRRHRDPKSLRIQIRWVRKHTLFCHFLKSGLKCVISEYEKLTIPDDDVWSRVFIKNKLTRWFNLLPEANLRRIAVSLR